MTEYLDAAARKGPPSPLEVSGGDDGNHDGEIDVGDGHGGDGHAQNDNISHVDNVCSANIVAVMIGANEVGGSVSMCRERAPLKL